MNKASPTKKIIKISVFLILAFVIAGTASAFYLFYSRVPQMNGELKLKNLSGKVSVVRDQNGVAHISAENNRDAFYALGFVMASERLFQMEISRRLAKGELAEIIGEKALPSDRLFRNLGLRDAALKMYNRKIKDNTFDPEMLSEAQAFYDGINEFVKTGPTPVEFIILGIKPAPFSFVDGQSFTGLMGFSFGIAVMTEPLLSKLTERIGADLVEDLRNEKIPPTHSRVVSTEGNLSKKIVNIISSLEAGFTLFEGSNGWLLSKERTQSGSTLLANDPHISYSQPGVWFEAHIKTPHYESYGHYLTLVPFPILFHNKDKAWGLTMSLVDDMDIYRENLDLKNKTYLYKGEARPLIERREVIKVKKSKDVIVDVFSTHHGPVLDSALSDTTNDKSLALQWSFYEDSNDAISSVYKMGKAKNIDEFRSAVATGVAPGLNILYADRDNIAAWIFGKVWKKRPGIKTDFILNGENGEDEILGELSFEEKPHDLNPRSGLIVSSNTRPGNYPENLRGDWQPADRYNTLLSILSQKDKWSIEETKELQALTMNFENKELIQILLRDMTFKNNGEEVNYAKHIELLKKWDLNSSVDSPGAALYYSWAKTMQIELLVDLTPDEKEIFAKVPNGWIFFTRVIKDSDSAWWKKFNRGDFFRATFIKTIQELEKKLGSNPDKWRWGKLHTVEFVHPLGRMKPLNTIFNIGPYEASGATQEVNNQKVTSFKGDFSVTAGPSTRRIIDFSNPSKAWGILPAGNSGHVLSPFYKDQTKRFLNGQYREELMELEEKDIFSKLILTP